MLQAHAFGHAGDRAVDTMLFKVRRRQVDLPCEDADLDVCSGCDGANAGDDLARQRLTVKSPFTGYDPVGVDKRLFEAGLGDDKLYP